MRRRRIPKITSLLILLLVIGPVWCAAQHSPSTGARVALSRDGTQVTVLPIYAAPRTILSDRGEDEAAWTYDFTLQRTGASTSKTRQGGSFVPASNAADTLSTVRITAVPGDTLRYSLVIRRDDRILTQTDSTFVVPPSSE